MACDVYAFLLTEGEEAATPALGRWALALGRWTLALGRWTGVDSCGEGFRFTPRAASSVSRAVLPFLMLGSGLGLVDDAAIGDGASPVLLVLLLLGRGVVNGGRAEDSGLGFVADFGGGGASSTKS